MNVLERTLFDLKTIASIPKGKRLDTSKEFVNIAEETVMQGVWRTLTRDSREKSVSTVKHKVEIVIMYAEMLMESKHLYEEPLPPPVNKIVDTCDQIAEISSSTNVRAQRIRLLKEIRNVLSESVVGINNVCDTYMDDSNVTGELLPITKCIKDKVTTITKLLAELGESPYIRIP